MDFGSSILLYLPQSYLYCTVSTMHSAATKFLDSFFQRILPALSNSHCWNWLLSWLNLFLAKLRQCEQSSSKVHFCLMLRSKSILSWSQVGTGGNKVLF
jgi:hypothetical protein